MTSCVACSPDSPVFLILTGSGTRGVIPIVLSILSQTGRDTRSKVVLIRERPFVSPITAIYSVLPEGDGASYNTKSGPGLELMPASCGSAPIFSQPATMASNVARSPGDSGLPSGFLSIFSFLFRFCFYLILPSLFYIKFFQYCQYAKILAWINIV